MTIVNSLWVGPDPLGYIQLLAIKSYQAHGHTVRLWTYTPDLRVPAGTELGDANDIIPARHIFRLGGQYAGNLSFFSDRFCLALLYHHGGWFTQMDVTCLKPLTQLPDLVFAPHDITTVAAYIMRAPSGMPAFAWMLNTHKASFYDRQIVNWHDSMRIIGEGVAQFGLTGHIQPRTAFDDDSNPCLEYFEAGEARPPDTRYVHHWCDSVTYRLSNGDRAGSYYHDCLVKYGLVGVEHQI